MTTLLSFLTFLFTFSFQQSSLKINLIALLCNIIASALAAFLKAYFFFFHAVNCHTPDDPLICLLIIDGDTGGWELLSCALVSAGILGRPLL